MNRRTGPFQVACVVRTGEARFAGSRHAVAQQIRTEHLRCLHCEESTPIDRLRGLFPVDAQFYSVGDGKCRYACTMQPGTRNEAVDQAGRDERTGGIMHGHDLIVRRQALQAVPDAVGAFGASYREPGEVGRPGQYASDGFLFTRCADDVDAPDAAAGGQRIERPANDRNAAQLG